MTDKLAINGGNKFRDTPFPRHPVIGENEKKAVMDVLERGELSTFIASPGEQFLGGKKIREFERQVMDYFEATYAVAMNSASACLHAAVVAMGVKPGDEVLVTPFSFTTSATSALMHNAIPIFVDINDRNFCLDPGKIEAKITSKTKAIIVVHLFGQPADMDEILAVAQKHSLKVIEDCAQAPGAVYKGKLAGTMGDCGIFSFTESKHVTTGEGGMLITNDEQIAEVSRLVRNHGEMILTGKNREYKSYLLGWGYRMTEMEAALGIIQFAKLNMINEARINLSQYLYDRVREISGIYPANIPHYVKHVFFFTCFRYNEEEVGIPQDLFVNAMNAEGIPLGSGYVAPLYLNPIFHENKHFVFDVFKPSFGYDPGACPVAEKVHKSGLIHTMMCRPPATTTDMDDIIGAMKKVISLKHTLPGSKKFVCTDDNASVSNAGILYSTGVKR